MLSKNLIRESNSQYASPVVLVKKNNGEVRFSVDYRKINAETVEIPYPTPNMDELLATIGPAVVFTALDLESGYHQIYMDEESIGKTTFITRDGHFEWLRMPFGFINAPYTFQKIMNFVFREFLWKCAVVYLDDILIFSKSEAEHLIHLEMILKKISSCGFRLNLKKCSFAMRKIDFLGFEVSQGMLKMQELQRTRILDILNPNNVSELRSVIGLLTFFRKFVPGFTVKIDTLLNRLKKGNFSFGVKEKRCLEAIKTEIVEAGGLIFPRMELPFIIYSDASGFGIGAALVQNIDGRESVVSWICRKLSLAELNYTTTEKEFLAVVWAIKRFKVYLFNNFIVKTDHSALKWLLKQKEPEGRLARWIMALQEYKYQVQHISGKENVIADALSRGILKSNDKANLIVTQVVLVDNDKMLEATARAHEDLGHAGTEAVYLYLKKQYNYPKMRDYIKEFINRCEVCQKFADKQHRKKIVRIAIKDPFYMIGTDLIGPLPKTENGNRFIIVATDYLTRWAEAKTIKRKKKKK